MRSPSFSSYHANRGMATLVTVLFVGLGLSAAAVSTTAYIRSSQSNAVTLHAQTQAQEKVVMGYVALDLLLKGKSNAEITALTSGSITPASGSAITYSKSTSCPSSGDITKPYYCFDITAKSGGATAVAKAIYNYSEAMGTSTQTGSIFAGGLKVGGHAEFEGDSNSTIKVKDGIVVDASGNSISLEGITIDEYVPSPLPSPSSLRKYSNYIFTRAGASTICNQNNLNGSNSETPCLSRPKSICFGDGIDLCYTGTNDRRGAVTKTYTDSKWHILMYNLTEPGVFWFDGSVIIDTGKNAASFAKTIIATESLNLTIPSSTSSGTQFNIYSPAAYYAAGSADKSDKACGTTAAAAQRPTQYCDSSRAVLSPDPVPAPTPALTDDEKARRAIANINLFAGDELSIDSGNGYKVKLYGNLISSTGAGGTGRASAKFTGSGDIVIIGNIIISGSASMTEMMGNIDITLKDSTEGLDIIPTPTYTIDTKGFSYL